MVDPASIEATAAVILRRSRESYPRPEEAKADVVSRNPGVVIVEMRTTHRFWVFQAKTGTTTEAAWPDGVDIGGYKLAPKLAVVAPARAWCPNCCSEVAVLDGVYAAHKRPAMVRARTCARSGTAVKVRA